MTIIGNISGAAKAYTVQAGSLLVGDPQTITSSQFLWKVALKVDGLGAAAGAISATACLFTEAGALVASGSAVVVADGAAAGAVWCSFAGSRGRVLTPGKYRPALLIGGATGSGRAWSQVAEPSPRPAVIVGTTSPGAGPFVRFDHTTDPLALTCDVVATGAGATGNASLWAQPTDPSPSGSYVWLTIDRESVSPTLPLTINVTTGSGGTAGDDAELTRSVGGRPDGALRWADFKLNGTVLEIDCMWAPASQPSPPQRLDAINHVEVVGELLEVGDLMRIPDIDDEQLADLPWSLSQRALSTTGPVGGSAVRVRAGWHGVNSTIGRQDGAQVVVRSGSALAGWVGRRVRISRQLATHEAEMFGYIVDEQDFGEDVDEVLLVTRRGILALASPTLDSVPVTVEVLR